METQPDFVLVNPLGEQVAAVEIKNAETLTEPLAFTLRDHLVTAGLAPSLRFVLVVSQDRGFLFDRLEEDPRPSRIFPLFYVFRSYYPPALPHQRFRESELAILVEKWLRDLTLNRPRERGEAETALDEQGFLEAVRGSRVVAQASV